MRTFLSNSEKLEFLEKLRQLLSEYDVEIEVEEPGYEYEGYLTIYKNDGTGKNIIDYNIPVVQFEHDEVINEDTVNKYIEQLKS